MRILLFSGLILTALGGAASAEPHGQLFISPMGEPFRSEAGGTAPQDLWFNAADTDHDGALTRAEFQADAKRFFAILDRRHDGEIDPDDIEYYETVMVPEIRVSDFSGMQRSAASEFDGGEETTRRDASASRVRQGAARYSYFDYPEPVVVADRNFNRGVDPAEFAFAADKRFDMLDKNGDGKIEHDELPKIVAGPAPARGGGGGRGGKRGGGHHGGGGMRGGGMGNMGGMSPGGDGY
jgi:Ca2+-binding EF-hand superfamily protein